MGIKNTVLLVFEGFRNKVDGLKVEIFIVS